MFKAAVVAFALTVSGFMLWIAHEDAKFAQLPHATFVKRAAGAPPPDLGRAAASVPLT